MFFQLERNPAEIHPASPTMNRLIWLGLLCGGVILIISGVKASDSAGSSVSRFFNGAPTDKAMWLLIGGSVATVIGVFGLLRGSKAI